MEILVISVLALCGYMTFLFTLSVVFKNNGIADVGYGVAFLVLIGTALVQSISPTIYALLLCVLPFVWGIRLAVRIFRKNYGKPEDFRYKAWRDAWGKSFLVRSFFQVYMLQGTVVCIVALPVVLALIYPSNAPSIAFFAVGCLVWAVGFFFESVGDYQLDTFLYKKENKGKIMTLGLWKYSRHPNYFGESMMWFGIAIAASGITSVPILGFVSPLLITFLLLKVSGVPMLEERFKQNPDWEAYASKTSVFVPLPPKHYSTLL